MRFRVSGRDYGGPNMAGLIEPSMVGWRASEVESGAIDPGCNSFKDAGEKSQSIFMVFETP